jgi:hypothetical protein
VACFFPGRAKDLSAPLYDFMFLVLPCCQTETVSVMAEDSSECTE